MNNEALFMVTFLPRIYIYNVSILSEFRTRIVECLHIRTLSRMLEPFDVQNEIIPDIVVSGKLALN